MLLLLIYFVLSSISLIYQSTHPEFNMAKYVMSFGKRNNVASKAHLRPSIDKQGPNRAMFVFHA